MRIGIIAASNIKYSPYIFFYTEILKRIGVEYELIVANRYGLEETFDAPLYEIPWDRQKNLYVNNYRYAKAVKETVKKHRYDMLIVLTSVNMVFLALWLKRHFKKKYIGDIRDYSHENIPLYFLMEKTAIKNAAVNVISSARFRSFLPAADYSICHNYNEKANETEHFTKTNGQLTIGYVGALHYVEQCNRLMELVANDPRFILEFYGTSINETAIRKAADEIGCERIVFHGAYEPKEKESIICKVDILFNAYGNGIPLLDCALSNKLYDALIYKKPILTCPNTYMTEIAGPLAFPIDLKDKNALNELYEWYQKIDSRTVEEYARRTIDTIRKENQETREKISGCIQGKMSR